VETEREDLIPGPSGDPFAAWALAGSVALAVAVIVGIALVAGWIQIPVAGSHLGPSTMDELARSRILAVFLGISAVSGSIPFLAIVGTVLVWVALLRPQLPERVLFAAAVILGTCVVAQCASALAFLGAVTGNHAWYSLFGVPDVLAMVATASYAAIFTVARELPIGKRRTIELVAVVLGIGVIVGQFALHASAIAIGVGVALGVACFCFAVAAAQRSRLDLFPLDVT